jgi:hypothetical protein
MVLARDAVADGKNEICCPKNTNTDRKVPDPEAIQSDRLDRTTSVDRERSLLCRIATAVKRRMFNQYAAISRSAQRAHSKLQKPPSVPAFLERRGGCRD